MQHVMAILCIVLLQASLLMANADSGKRLIERFSGNSENEEAFGAKELYDDMYDAEADADVDAYDYEDDGYYADAYEEDDENVYADYDGLEYYDEEGAYDYADAEEGDYGYEEAEGDYYDDAEEGAYAAYDDEDYYDEDYAQGDYYDEDMYDDSMYDADLYDDEYYGDYYDEEGYDEDYAYDLAALQELYNYNAYRQMYNQQYAAMMREYANLYEEANEYEQNYMNAMQQQGQDGVKTAGKYNPSQSVANAYNAYQNEYGYY